MSTSLMAPRPPPDATLAGRRDDDRRWFGVFALWLVIALLASGLGVVARERIVLVPIAIAGGVLALTLAYFREPSFRAFAQRVDLRIPILFHVVRLPIGIVFLVYEAQGRLDPTFANRAGRGDVLAGALAAVAALAWPARTSVRRAIVGAWNSIGLVEILLVVATAQYLLFAKGRVAGMLPLATFPGSAIPLFVVPVVIATHFLIFARLRVERATAAVNREGASLEM